MVLEALGPAWPPGDPGGQGGRLTCWHLLMRIWMMDQKRVMFSRRTTRRAEGGTFTCRTRGTTTQLGVMTTGRPCICTHCTELATTGGRFRNTSANASRVLAICWEHSQDSVSLSHTSGSHLEGAEYVLLLGAVCHH
jgi:hypothetical protein